MDDAIDEVKKLEKRIRNWGVVSDMLWNKHGVHHKVIDDQMFLLRRDLKLAKRQQKRQPKSKGKQHG